MNNPDSWDLDGDTLKVGDVFTEEWLDRFRALMAAYNASHATFDGFRVFDGDELYAECSGPRDEAWKEALRYASQCTAPKIDEVLIRNCPC